MVLAAAIFLIQATPLAIPRDSYGVPHIQAPTVEQAFFEAGYATAEDRLWQMEQSRRVARGRMAEAFGPQYLKADRETLLTSYTDAELDQQYNTLSATTRSAFDNYVRGVNAYIDAAKAAGSLPPGYKENDLAPAPWTKEDSLAIAVLLMQQFGRFGAGEIRNMAVLAYLDTQPKAKDRKLDIFEDLAWENDPKAATTVAAADDPVKTRPQIFPPHNRATTEHHLSMLPKASLFELLPGVRLSERQESRRVAELRSAPFKAGSYALLVTAKKSSTGRPLLLSGPQMGFTNPSIVHETAMDCPGIRVAGMDVPGVPGVLVGATPYVAWGLTSGVADTDDVFFYPLAGKDSYRYGAETRPFERVERTLHVKGGKDENVVQLRTLDGPVVVRAASGGAVFVRRPASYMCELKSLDAAFDLYGAKSADDAERAMSAATMNFNFFYATAAGDVGYHYVGRVPLRASGLDPRFPTPGDPAYEWLGMVDYAQMPHVRNPKSGIIANWNNKPAAWWPNGDSPVWGRVFRVNEVLAAADQPQLGPREVEMVPWQIARRSESFRSLGGYFRSGIQGGPEFLQAQARAYAGWAIEGSVGARLYSLWVSALRSELFVPTTGNFLDPSLFELATGPSVLLAALEKRTVVNYLQGRTPAQVSAAAWKAALAKMGTDPAPWGLAVDSIALPDQPSIPYRNRGTYIQMVQVGPWGAFGRNVLPPGESETGPHAFDQVPLARAWTYKTMTPLVP